MKLLVIGYKRPAYLQRCLHAISAMPGIRDIEVLFQLDWGGGCGSIQVAYEWDHPRKNIFLNKCRLGCNGNVYAGLARAFDLDDTVAIIEDDVEVYPDWLEFVTRPEFNEPSVLAVSTYRRHLQPPEPDWSGYERVTDLGSSGWYTWRRSWDRFKHVWAGIKSEVQSWDNALCLNFFQKHPESVIVPKVGRAFNFGEKDGTYCTSSEAYWHYQYTPYWAGKMT